MKQICISKRFGSAAILCATLLAVGTLSSQSAWAQQGQPGSRIPELVPFSRRNPIVEAIGKTRDAIVNIRTMRFVPARFDNAEQGGRVKGLGTGVIIDPRGYLVTNYHVVENVNEIKVLTSEGREYQARVINYDERADLAVLRIQSTRSFHYIPLWGVGDPILGETVIAIGNPYGLENTVTTGIVSAVNRELKLPNGEVFDDLIQTDASINPGNSGGPLLNINGDLLGVNVAIRSNAQGIGFAIPTDKVRTMVEQLMGKPLISITSHGLFLEETELTNVSSKINDSPLTATATTSVTPLHTPIIRVSRVEPESTAFRTGFRSGDEIVAVAGQKVRMQFDLDRILWDRRYGESLIFKVLRSGKETELKLTITPPKEFSDEEALWQVLGIQVRTIPADRVSGVHNRLNGGLLLVQVREGTPAAQAGFQAGDVLIGLHEWETIEANNVRYVMQWDQLSKNQPVKYHLIRDGKLQSGTIQIPVLP